jgi:hypothetical protein
MDSKLITLISTLLFISSSFSQSKNVSAPATLNDIYYYNKSSASLLVIEKGKADFVTRTKGFGFGGAATNFELNGDKSAFRIIMSDSVSFVVSLASGAGDPSTLFSLFKAEVKKDKRISNYVNTKVYYGKNGSGDAIISFTVKKIGDQIFEIIPSVKLDKGEYVFINKGTLANYGGRGAESFSFGID